MLVGSSVHRVATLLAYRVLEPHQQRLLSILNEDWQETVVVLRNLLTWAGIDATSALTDGPLPLVQRFASVNAYHSITLLKIRCGVQDQQSKLPELSRQEMRRSHPKSRPRFVRSPEPPVALLGWMDRMGQ
jgi:hypothetical protein